MNGYHSVLRSASFLRSLLDFDLKTTALVRAGHCCHCGGPLNKADFFRKPRGVPQELEKEFSKRLSLCCGAEGCRKRTTPPSVRFLDRRVYIGVTFVLLSMLCHGVTDKRQARLRREFHGEFPADERTLARWREWWQHVLPASPFWRVARSQLRNPVPRTDLPAGLVQSFTGDPAEKLASTLKFLSLLSPSSCPSGSGTAMVS